jgi:hypothetical protein
MVPTGIFLEGLRKFMKNVSDPPATLPNPNTRNSRKRLGNGTIWSAVLYKAADINDRQLQDGADFSSH